MSAIAVDSRLGRTFRFYDSTIGKKVVMAVTGAIMVGFLIAHMAGNLQFFLGREALNHYAVLLRTIPELLWLARCVLLLSVVLHIVASLQLARTQLAARPVGYVKKKAVGSSYASRTMLWSGPIIAAFIVYHLLHFTIGTVHPDFKELDPYDNVIAGFSVWPVAVAYIIAMIMLGTHLYHGVWSMFQTVGANNPRYSPKLRLLAKILSIILVLGFISVPVAVLAGVRP